MDLIFFGDTDQRCDYEGWQDLDFLMIFQNRAFWQVLTKYSINSDSKQQRV